MRSDVQPEKIFSSTRKRLGGASASAAMKGLFRAHYFRRLCFWILTIVFSLPNQNIGDHDEINGLDAGMDDGLDGDGLDDGLDGLDADMDGLDAGMDDSYTCI